MSNSEFFTEDMEEEGTAVPDDELYARLNLARDCSAEEISSAFRRLSRIFHPDKHSDPARRLQAQTVFQNVKEAFDVLSDPRRRAIYDMYGKRGLEMHGWELVLRTPTVAEVRAEHERLRRRTEEERLLQRTQPSSWFSFGIDASDLFDRYLKEPRDERFEPPRIQMARLSMQQSVVGHLTRRDTLKLAGSLGRSDNRSGVLQLVWRRLLAGGGHVETSMQMPGSLMPVLGLSMAKNLNSRVLLSGGFHLKVMRRNRGQVQLVPGAHSTVIVQLAQRLRGQMTINWNVYPMVVSDLTWTTAQGHKFSVNAEITTEESSVGISHIHDFKDQEIIAEVGVSLSTRGLVLKYKVEKQITSYTKVSATMRLGVPIGVTVTLKMLRGSQAYLLPINLSENVDPVAAFYGTVVPLAVYYICKRLLFDPWQQHDRQKVINERRRETAAERAEKRREAEAAQLLMTETVRRVREEEAARQGLLIERAVYGCATETRAASERSPSAAAASLPNGDFGADDEEATVTDVTMALEAMIINSALILPAHEARRELPGFYDPCPDEAKVLLVRYRFRGLPHEATFADDEAVRLPQERHRTEETRTPADDDA